MRLSIGFSPCPNDTFIFDALVNGKIDKANYDFDVVLEDVQTLNDLAKEGRLDITKLSFPAFFDNESKYSIISSGAALGKGVGPLLIAKNLVALPDMEHCSVAIPGLNTTAHFLLNYALPSATNKKPMLFSLIENAVLNNEADLGVIIHENRFTYQQKGLVKVLDLGEYWEQQTGLPIPLGCIAIKNTIDELTKINVESLIRKSVLFSLELYPFVSDYVKQHAQAMEEDIMRQHIELYVNDFSVNLGIEGEMAITKLKEVYHSTHH